MIRPLPYCTTIAHIQESLQTIDQRIAELQALKEQYAQYEKRFHKHLDYTPKK